MLIVHSNLNEVSRSMLLDHLNYCNVIIKCNKFEIGEDDKINYGHIKCVLLVWWRIWEWYSGLLELYDSM